MAKTRILSDVILLPDGKEIIIVVADDNHLQYTPIVCDLIDDAAQKRGTGIAKHTPDMQNKKIQGRKAVIALCGEDVVGFVYLESWDSERYISHSGLIVNPDYRNMGVATRMKKIVFELSRDRFPNAKIFGITTSLPVMKINTELGYKPTTFSELTQDDAFWKGCEGCRNFDILTRTERSKCLCTGFLFDPEKDEK